MSPTVEILAWVRGRRVVYRYRGACYLREGGPIATITHSEQLRAFLARELGGEAQPCPPRSWATRWRETHPNLKYGVLAALSWFYVGRR